MNTKTYIPSLFFIAVLAISCCTKKAIVDETDTKTTTVKETPFDSTGYTEGTIIYSEEEDVCAYTILIKDNIYYDPVDLKDEFKIDRLKVYFKFTGLRMLNRCNKANPVKINEIIVNPE